MATMFVGAMLHASNDVLSARSQQIPPGADPLVSSTVGLGKEATVLIVISPDCQPCLESIAFYKKLLALPRMDGTARRLVILAQNGVIPVKRLLDEQNFKPHGLTSGPAATHEIQDLPTLIVLDPSGKRRGNWTGKLTAKQEAEVLASIGK
jgi:hypothetical protein